MKYKLIILLMISLVIPCLRAQDEPEVKEPVRFSISDEKLQDIISQRIGEYYYGLYMGRKKAGYAKTVVQKRLVNNRFNIIQITTMLTWEVKAARTEKAVTITLDTAFFAEAPYTLFLYKAAIKNGRVESTYLLSKTLKGYAYSTNVKGVKTEKDIPDLNYTLTDFWANELWVPSLQPEKGDRIIYPTLDVTVFGMKQTVSQVVGIETKVIDGAETEFYRLRYTDENSEMECTLNEEGIAWYVQFSNLIELKLLPREIAAGPSVPFDYVYDNMVPLRPVPNITGKVKQLDLLLRAPAEVRFDNASGQKAEFDNGKKAWIISLDSTGTYQDECSDAEKQLCLLATERLPADNEKIRILAQRNVGSGSDEKKIINLALFVNKLLKDRVVLEPQTVLETIEKKRGDCSEHSELLATLLRASGIPARTVTGLYFNKKLGGYIGHMWVETAVDGKWIPVDAALKHMPTDCRYIRFPLDPDQALVNSRSLSKMKIELIN